MPEKEVEGITRKLIVPFSQEMMDDDAALVRTSSPLKRLQGETVLQKTKFPSVETDAEADPHATAKKGMLSAIRSQEEITSCSRIHRGIRIVSM